MHRKIPSGSVFQRTYLDRKGVKQKTKTWFLKYYVNGKAVVLPSGTSDRSDAISMLRERMANIAKLAECSREPGQILVNQLLDLLIEDYRYQRRRTVYDAEHRVNKNLRPFFGDRRAMEVTSAVVKQYVSSRLDSSPDGAEPATINKELAYLRRAFWLGFEQEPRLVDRVPVFKMLPIENTRTGTISHEQYRKLRDSLPSYARLALVIAYHTGARKGEIQKIRIDKIDFRNQRIELPGATTKNKAPRYLPIYGDMKPEIDMGITLADPKCPFLIQRNASPVFDWEKSWKRACELAQLDHALFHDLRRTALTNMIEAGLSEKEVMEISGHKTRRVFDRYHIVSPTRMKQLGLRLEENMKAKDLELLGSDSSARQNAKVH